MRRINHLIAGLLCVVLAAAMLVPVSAHGCHGRRSRGYQRNVQTTVTTCPYEDCAEAGRHLHSGVYYCGYGHESGVCDNNCRALCPYENCDKVGRHLHDGAAYCGYDHTAGYCDGTCRALCPYENCGIAGRHTHYGTGYCGADHACGYCDNSCAVNVSYGCGHGHGCGRWA